LASSFARGAPIFIAPANKKTMASKAAAIHRAMFIAEGKHAQMHQTRRRTGADRKTSHP
jgi:hypothetical protein